MYILETDITQYPSLESVQADYPKAISVQRVSRGWLIERTIDDLYPDDGLDH